MLHGVCAPRRGRCVRLMSRAHAGTRAVGDRGVPMWGTDAGRPPSFRGNPRREGGEGEATTAPTTSGRRRFHSLTHAPQSGSFRDADWRRSLRAAVSSGLESHRPSPGSGRGDLRKQLGRRPLKGPNDLKTRPAPNGEPFPAGSRVRVCVHRKRKVYAAVVPALSGDFDNYRQAIILKLAKVRKEPC